MENKKKITVVVEQEGKKAIITITPSEDCEYGSEGLYCAAYPHGEWEKITKRTCKTCKREKLLQGISRHEAIEIMAKAIRNWEFPYSPRQIGWEDLSEDTKDDYKNMAEEALNALLEGEK